MASSSSALLRLRMVIEAIPDSATADGALEKVIENATNGRRWSQGTASGQVDRVYYVEGSLASGASDSYDLLAAGSLTDILGQAIDADELKGLIVIPVTGAIRVNATASNAIGLFDHASDLINVPGGGLAFDWGAAGLDVTTNSKFEITESTSAATATYKLAVIVAQ